MPVEHPFIIIGQIASVVYFLLFLALAPLAGWVENKTLKWACTSSSKQSTGLVNRQVEV